MLTGYYKELGMLIIFDNLKTLETLETENKMNLSRLLMHLRVKGLYRPGLVLKIFGDNPNDPTALERPIEMWGLRGNRLNIKFCD